MAQPEYEQSKKRFPILFHYTEIAKLILKIF